MNNRIKKRTIISCLLVIGVLLYFAYHSSIPVEQPNRHIAKAGWAYDFKYPFLFDLNAKTVNVIVEHQFHWEIVEYEYTVIPQGHLGVVVDIKMGEPLRQLAPGKYYIDKGVERVAIADLNPHTTVWR